MRFFLNKSSFIYADNAATTKLSECALEAMLPFLKDEYGNASSLYMPGSTARRAVENARQQVSRAIEAAPSEIYFTSGGSEANNWVLRGVTGAYGPHNTHIIVSAVEHASILNCCHSLEKQGVAITLLPVNSYGQIDVESLEKAIRPETKLVSVMMANNEVGTLQPVAEIGEMLESSSILFHTDAVQAVGQIPVHVSELKVDLLSASAHKFNGPKGIGFLFKKKYVELPPLISGGAQEKGQRAGTENVAAIVGLGAALEKRITELESVSERKRKLIATTLDTLKESIASLKINGDRTCSLPGTVNLRFDGISAEALAHLLALKGIFVSTSAACSAGKDHSSHVLLAMGLSEEETKSSLRISYGCYNTAKEVPVLCEALLWAINKVCAPLVKDK